MVKINVEYIESVKRVDVLTDTLTVKYTTDYVKQILPDITHIQAQKTLLALAKLYDDKVGISRDVIALTGKGVMSGLL